MNYLIIALVIALMLSPIFWIMPSPRQRRQTQLRQTAMKLGFQVKLCDLPQTHRDAVRQVDPLQGVVYRLPWVNAGTMRSSFQHLLIRAETEPLASAADPAVTALLKSSIEQLPEYITALEFASSGLAIYWREQGGIERLESLYEQLKALRDQFQRLL